MEAEGNATMLDLIEHIRWGWIDVIFSPDDDGWYAQREGGTTTVYPTREDLLLAIDGDPDPWEDD